MTPAPPTPPSLMSKSPAICNLDLSQNVRSASRAILMLTCQRVARGQRALQTLRHWSVRHASALKRFYDACARFAPYLSRPLQWAGARRMERVLRPLERAAKQLLFDCKMCGQCVLSSTGMACPTNCAKQMRNGPCGGVRADGTCEVNPAMRCVWVEAIDGLKRIGPPQQQDVPRADRSPPLEPVVMAAGDRRHACDPDRLSARTPRRRGRPSASSRRASPGVSS